MGEGKDRYKFAVLALIAIHLAIAIPLAYHLNIWSDEGSSLYTTQHGLYAAITGGITDEKQAPLYFGILSLWRMVNGSIFFARILSVLFSVLAIKFFAGLAAELFDRRTALPIAAFFALHPFLFWASLEIRAYSLVLLISVLIVKFFWRGFSDDLSRPETDTKARMLFLASSIVGLYTNYYLGFVLVGLFCVLLARRQWDQAISYLKLMIIASIACVPLAMVVRSQIAANTAGFQDPRSLFEAAQAALASRPDLRTAGGDLSRKRPVDRVGYPAEFRSVRRPHLQAWPQFFITGTFRVERSISRCSALSSLPYLYSPISCSALITPRSGMLRSCSFH